MKARDRRLKMLMVPKSYVLAFLAWRPGLPLAVHCLGAITDDTEVIDVVYDWQRQCFGLLLWHPEYPAVPEGGHVPWAGGTSVTTWVTVKESGA